MKTLSSLMYIAAFVLIVMSIVKNSQTKKIKTKVGGGIKGNPNNFRCSNTNNEKLKDIQNQEEENNYWAMEESNRAMEEGNRAMEEGNRAMEEGNRAMEEGMKTMTPFEQGGYNMDQGNSFNDFNNGGF